MHNRVRQIQIRIARASRIAFSSKSKGGYTVIKRVTVCWLPEGADPDKFWKFHKEVHAAHVIEVVGPKLKKYVINRMVRPINGKPTFFDMIETWWDNEEDMHQGFDVALRNTKLPSGKTIAEDFWSQTAGGFSMIVDEYVAKE